ncbi:DUF4214 domain-containing protein [Comamonas endophytica]|uniref:DUF4214 domain-containing protein n=1 Tax=Comamonas endophytica TaxID=2949090 RepID=UPI00362287FC
MQQATDSKQEIEKLLHFQVQREREISTQLFKLQQQSAQEKTDLARIQHEYMRVQKNEQADREKALAQQLKNGQIEVQRLQQERVRAEQDHAQQTRQILEKLEDHLRFQVQREQQFSTQLLVLEQEKAQHFQEHLKQTAALQSRNAEREEGLRNQLKVRQQELEDLQASRAIREQEIDLQLREIHRQASLEADKLHCDFQERTDSLNFQRAEQEKIFAQQLQAANAEILHLSIELEKREKEYLERASQSSQVIKELLSYQEQLQQKINQELVGIQEETAKASSEYVRLLESCTSIEAQLRAEIESNHQTVKQLRQLLTEVQGKLDANQASLAWRITAPLRQLARLLKLDKKHKPAPSKKIDDINKSSRTPEKTDLHPAITMQENSVDPFSPASGIKTANNMSTTASTLEELLTINGQQFIESAYRALLKRDPDSEGKLYYLSRLEAGYSKMQIISQLHFSKEGKERKPKLPGLDSAIKKYKRSQTPLVGWIFATIEKTENDGTHTRHLRALEYKIHNLANESSKNFERLEERLSDISKFISDQSSKISEINERTAQTNLELSNSLAYMRSLASQQGAQGNSPENLPKIETDKPISTHNNENHSENGKSSDFETHKSLSPLSVEDLIKISVSHENISTVEKISIKAKPLTIENLLDISKLIV